MDTFKVLYIPYIRQVASTRSLRYELELEL